MKVTRWVTTTEETPWLEQNGFESKTGEPMADPTGMADPETLVVTVNPDCRYQQVEGNGGCFNEKGWQAMEVLTEDQRQEVLASLFGEDGCRFTYCRMPIGASDYASMQSPPNRYSAWYSLNDTYNDYDMTDFSIDRDRHRLIPYIKGAMAYQPELKVWGSPWSPPSWMKMNKIFTKRDNPGPDPRNVMRWEPRVLEAYAHYFALYVKAYRAEGINVMAVHVQNEPVNDANFPSCRWTGERMRDFIRDYLGPRFEQEGLLEDTEIWLGTLCFGAHEGWADLLYADPHAARYTAGVGYQWAGREVIGTTYLNLPGVKLMQTEQFCGENENDWFYAQEHVFARFRLDYKAGINANMQWNMVLDETGRSSATWNQNSMVTIHQKWRKPIYNPQFYAVKHYTHFVQPGAVRIHSAGNYLDAVAFQNPDGTMVLPIQNRLDTPLKVAVRIGEQLLEPTLEPKSMHTLVIQP